MSREKTLLKAYRLYQNAENDPEDMLFLQFTMKEMFLLYIALESLASEPLLRDKFADTLFPIFEKVADSIAVQKGFTE